MKILSGHGHPKLAQRLALLLKSERVPTSLKQGSNGEFLLSLDAHKLRGQQVIIVQSLAKPVHNTLMEVFLLANAAKTAKADFITAVLPYYAYGRQDRPTKDSTGTTAELLPCLLAASGIDKS